MTKPQIPWNKDRAVGQKCPFTKENIWAITRNLEEQKQFRDLCLFCLGIDTMLRSSDLVRLKVLDVTHSNGHTKSEFTWSQKKTGSPVVSAITPYAQSAVSCHIASNGLKFDDYLFTAKRGDGSKPLTPGYLRRLVKKWAKQIGLDPTDYAGHSLRRSKPSHLYAQGVRPEMLRLLLGHKSLQSTQVYLGIDQRDALDLARKYDCFKES